MSKTTTSANTPRGEARRRAFLDAARQVFLAQGLGAASVNDVVRLAGGSLATLYAQFGSKEGLFLAMLEERVHRFVERLQIISASHLPLAEGLQEMGERFLNAQLHPEGIAIHRILVAEAKTYPEVVAQFQTMGQGGVRGAIRAYLEERVAAGEARSVDADAVANLFMEAVRATHLSAALMSANYTLTPAEVRESVARVVDLLINGIRAS